MIFSPGSNRVLYISSLLFVFFAAASVFYWIGSGAGRLGVSGGGYEAYEQENVDPISHGESLVLTNVRASELPSIQDENGENRTKISEGSFRLLAVFDTHDYSLASAVILVKGYGAYRYKKDELVFDDYVVEEIFSDRVVLSNTVGYESIYLDPLEVGVEQSGMRSSQNDELQIESREAYRKRQILETYDIYPVTEGAPDGYVIGDNFSPEIMKQTGVQPGDIIVSVNGYPVGEESNDALALLSFRESMKATVIVSRGGRSFTFSYPEDVPGAK